MWLRVVHNSIASCLLAREIVERRRSEMRVECACCCYMESGKKKIVVLGSNKVASTKTTHTSILFILAFEVVWKRNLNLITRERAVEKPQHPVVLTIGLIFF